MVQQTTDATSRQAYLAFQLGSIPDRARDGAIGAGYGGYELGNDLLFNALSESKEATELLGQLIDIGQKEDLKQNVLRALELWYPHIGQRIVYNDNKSFEENVESFEANVAKPLAESIRPFCQNLPRPYAEYAALGEIIYFIVQRNVTAHGSSETPIVCLQRLLGEIGKRDPRLAGLGINLSWAAFFQWSAGFPPGKTYTDWARNEVKKLEVEIIDRLLVASVSHQEFWITGVQAVAIAVTLGYSIDASKLSKECKKVPTPFKFRKPSPKRLDVELVSFLAYLETLQKSDKEPNENDDKIEKRMNEEKSKKIAGRDRS